MKKKAFIATSLIYSFFLVFIAIIAALISRYIANKTIMERFNEKVEENLNSNTYAITIYSRNSNIQGGMTLSNLISNGDFSDSMNFWNKSGSAIYGTAIWAGNQSIRKENNGVSNSYLYQKVYVLKNSEYYFSIDYSHNNSTILNTYIDSPSSGVVQTTNNQLKTWTRGSNTFKPEFDANLNYVLGNSSFGYTGTTYFTHAMVLNLTASFGPGNEPDKSWVDDHIEWFSGTMSYIRKENLASGESIEIKFLPYTDFTRYTINCSSDSSDPLPRQTMEMDTVEGNVVGTFKLHEVHSNIKCTIDWRS